MCLKSTFSSFQMFLVLINLQKNDYVLFIVGLLPERSCTRTHLNTSSHKVIPNLTNNGLGQILVIRV